MNDTQALIVFVKYPKAGLVKTRLGKSIGMKQAAKIYQRLAQETIKNLTPAHQKYQTIICYDPQTELEKYQVWLGKKHTYLAQTQGNLGIRMKQSFEYLFARGYFRLVLVGTDCPELNKHYIQKSLELLNRYDLVLGPATDGGYYLIGLNRPNNDLFAGIRWSTKKVLAQTIAKARQAKLSSYLLKELSDIDRIEDLSKEHYL